MISEKTKSFIRENKVLTADVVNSFVRSVANDEGISVSLASTVCVIESTTWNSEDKDARVLLICIDGVINNIIVDISNNNIYGRLRGRIIKIIRERE